MLGSITHDSKQIVRKAILELRNRQPHHQITQKSDQIQMRLLHLKEYQIAKTVMLYSGKETEVQTEKLIRHSLKQKRVILPITNSKERTLELSEIKDYDNELIKAAFNILEPKKEYYRPVDLNQIDLIVVPGVVFDYQGNRLGYGFGYYDRLLTLVRRPIPFIGLAFEFQVVHSLPNSHNDVPVHLIVTEKKIIHCNKY
ncbi:MAG: 5-formyltetrahydrofolate cyclo-ligase [Candidatus Helarchaeota archaeon]